MAVSEKAVDTALLYRELLAERAAREKFDPQEIRLSEAGSCPRKQTLRALGYEADQPDERSLSIFQSGDEHEDHVYRLWAARFPRQVRRQVEVRTPFGTGHIDIYVVPIRRIVESKTTTEKMRERLPLASHVAQVTMYLHFWGHGRGATAEITYRIKETGEILSFPVEYDADLAERLVAGLRDVQAAIHLFQEPLPVPEGYGPARFPCAWTTPEGTRRCPYWRHCWGGEVFGEKGRVTAVSPALEAEAHDYARLRLRKAELDEESDRIRRRLESLEAVFGKALDDAGADELVAGNVTLRRARVEGRVITDVDSAIRAGVVTAEAIAPFQRRTRGYDRWTVQVREG